MISFAQIEETCRIIQASANADDSILGFDPTLRIDALHPPPRSFPSPIGTVEIDGINYDIISILWTSNGFIGRCTNAFHVRPQGAPPHIVNGRLDEYDFVVKDSWLDEYLASHEEDIYEHISGIKGVPTLLKTWTVQNAGDDDSTLRHRPSSWDRRELSPEYVTRIHRRLLMAPVGSPLSSFRSQREFLGGLITALESMSFVQYT
jgi:Fungal protein kinase